MRRIPSQRAFWIVFTLLTVISPFDAVRAQHASDNPAPSADDTFGFTLGLESIGIYGPGSVRGFSTTRPKQRLHALRTVTFVLIERGDVAVARQNVASHGPFLAIAVTKRNLAIDAERQTIPASIAVSTANVRSGTAIFARMLET
jgi:hypothetical protein